MNANPPEDQIYIDDAEITSLLSRDSRGSDSVSVMSESQGILIENPDGTLQHGNDVVFFILFLGKLASKAHEDENRQHK
jgi:hypothetical protein